MLKEVDFFNYCPHCEYLKVKEGDDPCNDCLNSPSNEDTTKPLFYKGPHIKENELGRLKGYYDSIKKIKDYLYVAYYNDIDYAYAHEYYLQKSITPFGCTSVVKGYEFGRNLDWFYNNQSEFIVFTSGNERRHASVGIAGGIEGLTNDFVESKDFSNLYRVLPVQLQDGMNDCGVTMSMNVVPNDYGNNIAYPRSGTEFMYLNGQEVVRFVLDNFKSAEDAAIYLSHYCRIEFVNKLHEMNYEIHYLLADKEKSYILEIVNNRLQVIECNDVIKPFITNFYIYNIILNRDGSVYTPEHQEGCRNAMTFNKITKAGSGLERYNIVNNRYLSSDLFELLTEDLKYTKTYSTSESPANPFWYTEYVSSDGLNAANKPEDFEKIVAKYGQIFANRSREESKTWHTTHSIVYDMYNKTAKLVTQEENTQIYDISLGEENVRKHT